MLEKPRKAAKSRLSPAQKRAIRHYSRLGYAICAIAEEGDVVPGYADWQIEVVLDELDWLNEILQPDAGLIGRKT